MQMTQNIVVLIFAVRKMNIVVDKSAALEALVERYGGFRCVCDMISCIISRCACVCLYIHVIAQS